MEEMKLTVRVSKNLVEKAKHYAAINHTTLTNLIETYLQSIPAADYFDEAPITRRLVGSVPADVSIEDYHEHLDKKYGG
jgi:hypothetical protein